MLGIQKNSSSQMFFFFVYKVLFKYISYEGLGAMSIVKPVTDHVLKVDDNHSMKISCITKIYLDDDDLFLSFL